ncbi:hypothetical protein MLD38_028541 [Melastoma candidum]|uniref:Uncharacterized protein n=1 Tax=Melastoma candidum TaxID=119954 RepID=A0ACB9N339_9MYRT|nr:hypothetical protein MLD38_028541 [Melastoma candidum]
MGLLFSFVAKGGSGLFAVNKDVSKVEGDRLCTLEVQRAISNPTVIPFSEFHQKVLLLHLLIYQVNGKLKERRCPSLGNPISRELIIEGTIVQADELGGKGGCQQEVWAGSH